MNKKLADENIINQKTQIFFAIAPCSSAVQTAYLRASRPAPIGNRPAENEAPAESLKISVFASSHRRVYLSENIDLLVGRKAPCDGIWLKTGIYNWPRADAVNDKWYLTRSASTDHLHVLKMLARIARSHRQPGCYTKFVLSYRT